MNGFWILQFSTHSKETISLPVMEAQKDHVILEALADGGIEVEEPEPSEKVPWMVAGGWFFSGFFCIGKAWEVEGWFAKCRIYVEFCLK